MTTSEALPCIASVYAKRPEGEHVFLSHYPLFFFAPSDDAAVERINRARAESYPEPLWESGANWDNIDPESYEEVRAGYVNALHGGEDYSVFALSVLGKRWEDDAYVVDGQADIFGVQGFYDEASISKIAEELAIAAFPLEDGWEFTLCVTILDVDLFALAS